MCPPAAAPLVDTDEYRANEELFMFMLCVAHGYAAPANVKTDVNPFNCLPETLAEDVWYFASSKENRGAEGGFWLPRGEPRVIFGEASINGWEATHEFYEARGLHLKKTNWLMLEYYITPKGSREVVLAKDPISLCKVYYGSSSPLSDHGMLQNVAGSELHGENYVFSLSPDNFEHTEQLVMQDDTTSCNIVHLPRHPVENLPELDHFAPDDYIELRDLRIPHSPSSVSEDSSCMTMTSDECFDFVEALLELAAESGDHVEHKDAGCNLSVSDSSKPDDIVVQAAISALPGEEVSSNNARDGRAVYRDGTPPLNVDSQSSELLNSSQTPSAYGRNKTDGTLRKLKRKYLATSSSQSSDGSNSGREPSPSPGGITKTDGTLNRLKKKCLCFMPF